MRNITIWIVAVLMVFVGAELAALELGGEVVTLHTRDARGRSYSNHVWIVENGHDLWIRALHPASPWLDRVVAEPEVQIMRGAELKTYRATPRADRRERINAAMAERYGWADWVLGMVDEREEAVPVYLDPFG